MSRKRTPNCARCGESLKTMRLGGTITHQFRFGRLVVRCGWHGDCMDDLKDSLGTGDEQRSTELIVERLRAIRERGPDRVLGILPKDPQDPNRKPVNVDKMIEDLRAAGLDAWDAVEDIEAELGRDE